MPETTPELETESSATAPPAKNERPAPKKTKSKKSNARPRAKTAARKPKKLIAADLNLPAEANSANLTRDLTAIYQEPDGTIPNMQTIDVRPTHRLANFLIGLLVLGVVGAGIVWVKFFWSNASPSPDSATIAIAGPANAVLGATTTYTISYANTTDFPFAEATINVYAPAGFIFLDSSQLASNAGHNEWLLGAIPAHRQGAITITGLPLGDVGSAASWRVFLRYRPQKFNSTLEQVATLATKITAGAPLVFTAGPAEVAVGADAAFTFTIKNSALLPAGRLELAPAWPETFVVSSTTPTLQNNRWLITRPATATSTPLPLTFKVIGKFTAASDTTTPVVAALLFTPAGGATAYQIAASLLPVAVTANDLVVNLAINGATSNFDSQPGDLLTITVRAKNNSGSEIKNATLKLMLDAPTVKKQTLVSWSDIADPLDGTIIGEQVSDAVRRGTITWDAKKLPALAKLKTNAEASVDLRVPLRSGEHFDLTSFPTSTVVATALLRYTDKTGAAQTVASAPITITVNSDLAFENRFTASLNADNKKQFMVTWVLSNSFHVLKNVAVSATLYGDVSWQQTASSTAGAVIFNPKEKTVVWNIAELPTSVDIATLPFSVTLNKDNPSQTTLISKVHIQADDAATLKHLDFLSDELSLVATSTSS